MDIGWIWRAVRGPVGHSRSGYLPLDSCLQEFPHCHHGGQEEGQFGHEECLDGQHLNGEDGEQQPADGVHGQEWQDHGPGAQTITDLAQASFISVEGRESESENIILLVWIVIHVNVCTKIYLLPSYGPHLSGRRTPGRIQYGSRTAQSWRTTTWMGSGQRCGRRNSRWAWHGPPLLRCGAQWAGCVPDPGRVPPVRSVAGPRALPGHWDRMSCWCRTSWWSLWSGRHHWRWPQRALRGLPRGHRTRSRNFSFCDSGWFVFDCWTHWTHWLPQSDRLYTLVN